MNLAPIGIIGGTGLGELLQRRFGGRPVELKTPFGSPSAPLIETTWCGASVVFLARHGVGHTLSPDQTPYRANIWALKKMGVSTILASGAVGSLREHIQPVSLVVCDQLIDRTHGRASTFFDDGAVVHVDFADPFCPRLRQGLVSAATTATAKVHPSGVYVCMQGPQFSTRAESNMHRLLGGDLVGMTCLPEAKLAREAEICYALIAMATDYDCWRPAAPHRRHDELLKEIQGNLKSCSDRTAMLLEAALPIIKADQVDCPCRTSLASAIWTQKNPMLPAQSEKLDLLLGRYQGSSA